MMMRYRSTSLRLVAATTTALLAGACSGDSPLPTGIDSPHDIEAHLSNVDAATWELAVCKVAEDGSNVNFTISATSGTVLYPSGFTLTAATSPDLLPGTYCLTVWQGEAGAPVSVTVSEEQSPFYQLDEIRLRNYPGAAGVTVDGYSVTLTQDYFATGANDGFAILVFKNSPLEPPPGLAGCTPGFWKQSQHFQYWTAPYTPGTLFGSIFANAFPNQTLLQVVSNGEGGLNALGRHTVAALLNAASPDVQYGMTPAEVIAAFNSAYASGDYETQKDIFEGVNELGCTATD